MNRITITNVIVCVCVCVCVLCEPYHECTGSGVRRERGKKASLSPGELQAVYYNTACALAAKGDMDGSLLALGSALESGFDDFVTLRRDPDLASVVQDPRLDQLLSRFDKGWFGRLFNGTRSYFN